jgi:hypothetical protein
LGSGCAGRAGAAYTGIPGDLRGERQDRSRRRPGRRPDDALRPGRHAAAHDGGRADGDRHHAGRNLFHVRPVNALRRVYTDGRSFPAEIDPSSTGYSIGKWQDSDGHGRFDTLAIETRAIKGPHTYDASGIPFHKDDQAVVTEKLYADKADPNILHDEITTSDHALTRPWTVTRSYRRDTRQSEPEWLEINCQDDTGQLQIGDQSYKLSPEGMLMPAIKGQKPPDLKYFK